MSFVMEIPLTTKNLKTKMIQLMLLLMTMDSLDNGQFKPRIIRIRRTRAKRERSSISQRKTISKSIDIPMSSPTETKMMTEVFTRKKIQKIQLLITMVTPMLDMELLTLTDGEKSTISCQDLTSLFQEPLLKKKPRLRLKMVMMLLKTGLLIHINGEK